MESPHALFGKDFPKKGGLPRLVRMCSGYSLVSGTTSHVPAAETPRSAVGSAVDCTESHSHSGSRAPMLVNMLLGH